MNNNNFVQKTIPFSSEDCRWMKVAINYARHGVGLTSKNPSVGCVIVKDNKLLGVGRTSNGGRPHAEENALSLSGKNSIDASLYVTLEPCAHKEQHTSCMEKIVKAKIKKVVIACNDPDQRTNGKAIKFLLSKNIIVATGCLQNEASELIEGFTKRILFKRPFITSKIASSLDSKIALSNGKSKWITGSNTRNLVHQYRFRSDAILTGINTVIKDNPLLDCRIPGLNNFSPIVFILDSKLKISLDSKIIKRKNINIITSNECNENKKSALLKRGINIKIFKYDIENKISMDLILNYLNELNINNLLIEAGSEINTFFMKNNLIDRIILCRSGHIFGNDSKSFLNEINLKDIPDTMNYHLKSSFQLDNDVIEHWDTNN